MYSTSQLASECQVSQSRVEKFCKQEQVPKVGPNYIIDQAHIEKFKNRLGKAGRPKDEQVRNR